MWRLKSNASFTTSHTHSLCIFDSCVASLRCQAVRQWWSPRQPDATRDAKRERRVNGLSICVVTVEMLQKMYTYRALLLLRNTSFFVPREIQQMLPEFTDFSNAEYERFSTVFLLFVGDSTEMLEKPSRFTHRDPRCSYASSKNHPEGTHY